MTANIRPIFFCVDMLILADSLTDLSACNSDHSGRGPG